ncbi:hypothetical protein [Virgibacillus sp. JSM 102003]|uniref:hypothetical protein n=1 Tax=Virgibacillus sp. JSM 102003 TaxID=1562108 RepID=UPI0035C140D7
MENLFHKVVSLKDLKYSWILITSIIVFCITLYLDLKYNPSHVPIKALVGYGSALIISVCWGVFNYIGHVRVNAMYRKSNDIHAFVNSLAMNQEEKLELTMYLEDYTQDLTNQGKTKEEASQIAINHFKIQEFSTLSKDTQLFNLHAHFYLWGYASIAALCSLVLLFISNVVVKSSLILIVLETAFAVTFFGCSLLFFIYKIIDVMIYRKLKENY